MAKKGSLLVVDDEDVMRDVLGSLLTDEGYGVDLASTGEEGLDKFQQKPYEVVLLDVSMPGKGGLRTLEEILKLDAEAVIIMITAYATFDTAIAAWQRGAFNCIKKPFDNKEILKLIASGVRRRRKDEERRALRQTLKRSTQSREIVARSDKTLEILSFVEQIAPARTTILITGESGTGKELIARAIHNHSSRSDKPFVTVNSANLPAELLESELFGHVRGAFTGALAAKRGYFEVADGGSIFLDEIGTISVETQSKLLRVIQERDFTPLGETTPRQVDVRIIAATNIDLRQAVEEGTFREDLFYRLNVISIDLPPLRERSEDILPLAQHFIRKYNAENGRHISDHISPEIISLLEAYNWPGNIRELENVMERAVIIARSDQLQREDLREEVLRPKAVASSGAQQLTTHIDLSRGISFYDEVNRFQVELIRRAMEITGGHQSRAAKLLGMNTTTLNSKIKYYRIQKDVK
ncbi:MAG TPA: sigma-54 dependent transcriptional regulator [Blastocatellia bacterium]|jgi:DNA-binding NtrC family response regulator|nr:sigma-54 dependent transcriptional regulator [Blastocatellia bacterium]